MVQIQYHRKIRHILTDNGNGFFNHNVRALLQDLGIIYQHSCVATSQQNGVVERKHCHLLEVAHALLFRALLLLHF